MSFRNRSFRGDLCRIGQNSVLAWGDCGALVVSSPGSAMARQPTITPSREYRHFDARTVPIACALRESSSKAASSQARVAWIHWKSRGKPFHTYVERSVARTSKTSRRLLSRDVRVRTPLCRRTCAGQVRSKYESAPGGDKPARPALLNEASM